jgi:hypothetical protein
MSAKTVIDPRDPHHHGKPVWCVYGDKCALRLLCCKLQAYTEDHRLLPTGTPGAIVCIWGYSVYNGIPGFRTLGQNIETWQRGAEFYAEQGHAIDRLRALTTPKVGA